MVENLLAKAGLSPREVTVFMALGAKGEMMASGLSKETGIIRTNVYDILESLIRKGLVSYVIRDGNKFFRSSDPEKLLDYVDTQKRDLEEIRDEIKSALPRLRPAGFQAGRPVIRVFEGKEGMKTILEMSIRESRRTGKEILGLSVKQRKCRALAGVYHLRWYKDRERFKIRARYLMSSQERILPIAFTEFKRLPPTASNPDEVFIFGDTTAFFFFVGGLFTAILISNKEITRKYRQYFDFLWGVGAKPAHSAELIGATNRKSK